MNDLFQNSFNNLYVLFLILCGHHFLDFSVCFLLNQLNVLQFGYFHLTRSPGATSFQLKL